MFEGHLVVDLLRRNPHWKHKIAVYQTGTLICPKIADIVMKT